MGAFELPKRNVERNCGNDEVLGVTDQNLDPRRLREECIIALKVYDSCRHLNCKLLHHTS